MNGSLAFASCASNMLANNTRQGYARKRTLKPAGYFFNARTCAFARKISQQHPSRLSWKRTRGVTFFSLTGAATASKIHLNTPAMPLHDAHFGGFFVSGVCR